jgi:hypothetical protein
MKPFCLPGSGRRAALTRRWGDTPPRGGNGASTPPSHQGTLGDEQYRKSVIATREQAKRINHLAFVVVTTGCSIFVAGPVGTVKKPTVFCEALFKLRWESAFFADFHRSVSFHRPSVLSFLLLFSFFGPTHSFPQRNSAPGSPRNDDRQLARPAASPVSPLFKRMVPFQSTSPLAADNPDSDATVRSYKTESITRFPCVPPKRIGSQSSDTPPHILGNATSVR